jgi:hypothetical protein
LLFSASVTVSPSSVSLSGAIMMPVLQVWCQLLRILLWQSSVAGIINFLCMPGN